MIFLERVDSFAVAFWGGIGASVAAGVVYVFRVVFTNQRKVDKLVDQLKHRDELREAETRAVLEQFNRLHSEVSELRADISQLYAFELRQNRKRSREDDPES